MVMFVSLGDCAGENILDCLQSFHLRRVNIAEKEDGYRALGLLKSICLECVCTYIYIAGER